MNNLNHSVLSECRNQFYEKIKFLHVLNNENLFSISVEIGFLVENRVRDAEGATEGSRAKHRSEAKPKAARPERQEMRWQGARPKIKNAQPKAEHFTYIEVLIKNSLIRK